MIKIIKKGVDLERSLKRFHREAQPKAEARAINKTVSHAQTQAVRYVARVTKLPQKYIRNRVDVDGKIKQKRIDVRRKANPYQKERYSLFQVYMRGVPLFQVAKKRPKKRKPWVERGGGRTYHGAFYGFNKKLGVEMVFKPIRKGLIEHRGKTGQGSRGGRLMMPKIGVRERLNRGLAVWTRGRKGIAVFEKEFDRVIKLEAKKIR